MRYIPISILLIFALGGCASHGYIFIDKDPEIVNEKGKRIEIPDIAITTNRPFEAKVKRNEKGEIVEVEIDTKGKSLLEGFIQPAGQIIKND